VLELAHGLLERCRFLSNKVATGTRTSLKNTSQKWELPVRSRIGRTSMPSTSIGTISSLIPAWDGPSVAVRQIR
jgi:hypothetical protein